jgi:dolichol-phosphate mannosyltransferase
MKIAVVIPTYNEVENLPKLVDALRSLPLDLKILIVDDNSPDGTGRIADRLARQDSRIQVLHRPGKLGLRSAYLDAFQHLLQNKDVDALVQMDADLSHEPSVLVDMAHAIETSDLVLGSRYIAGGSVDERWPISRKWLSAFGNFYSRSILGIHLRDVTTGYRLWRRNVLEDMPLNRIRASGYVFQVEMVYLAYCLEYRIAEVPIYFAERNWGKSKITFRIQAEAALHIWLVLWDYRDIRKKGRGARLHQSMQSSLYID